METFGEFRPGGTDSESLQGWILKFREDRKKICTRVGNFFNWLVNQSPPWAAYRAFISVHLIALDNKLGMHAVSVGEPWRRLFVNCVLKVNGPESTNACQDDQLCARLKAVIDGAVHRVQYIWDANLSTENWGFLLVDAQNAFNEINRIEMLWKVLHLWPSRDHFFKFSIVTGHRSSCGTGMGRPVFSSVGRVRQRETQFLWLPMVLIFSH